MEKAKWIWLHDDEVKDEHVQFYDSFFHDGKNAVVKISCDTNYVLYVNGNVAAFGQYPAYPNMRVYDTVDISEYTIKGDNEIAIHVWYWGIPAMVYSVGKAGLLYQIESDGKIVGLSDEKTLCRLAPNYEQGHCKKINNQQGLTCFYNPNGEDGFGKKNYKPEYFYHAIVRNVECSLYPRPNKKLIVSNTRLANFIDAEKKIYDLGCECSGVLHIKYRAKKNHRFSICFGEYVKSDGNLLRFFDAHDYTLNFIGNGEVVEHVIYLRRIGCRYFQVLGDNVEVFFLGLKETLYPITEIPVIVQNERIKQIYDISVRTLRLCMHEHYEDCPWREQVLYNMDSRNAMLCTYEAFKEYEFAKSNLWLMSFALKNNGLYPASFPSGNGCWSVIPLFNLIYIIQAREYLQYSGDTNTIRDILSVLESIIERFLQRLNGNLIKEEMGVWNFVEWTENMQGKEKNAGKRTPIVLNCALIMALEAMSDIYKAIGIEKNYSEMVLKMREKIFDMYYDEKIGAFKSYIEEDHVCELGNAFAVISGCAGDKSNEIRAKLAQGTWQKVSLAMKCFLYDALLEEGDTYREFILNDIIDNYGYMIDKGATSFWETLEGEKQYGGAGSLCHVWSAVPIIYLKKIGVVTNYESKEK